MQKNKLAVFDIDGTIFRRNLLFELINELFLLEVFPKRAKKDLVKLYASWLKNRGTYETYRTALVKLYAENIVGKTQNDIERASKKVIPFHQDRTYVFAEDLIKELKNKGYHIIAISGSPIEVVDEFNKMHLGFDEVFGTVYKLDENYKYTGKESFTPVKDKGQIVRQYVYENELTLADSYGVGDTESDASFLELVDNPIAFNPNYNLKKVAEKEGWKIKVERKDVIYDIK